MIHALCKRYSDPLLTFPGEETTYHPFPPPSALAEQSVSATLRSLGFGYRAEFIQRTAQMLVSAHGGIASVHDGLEPAEKWLMGLRLSATNEAREELLKFVGVGRKVADCILLMSLDKVLFHPTADENGSDSNIERSCPGGHTCPPDCHEVLWTQRQFQWQKG